MITAAIYILIVVLVLSAITVMAFAWAAGNKQFENSGSGSRVIFDEDEPEGRPTDPNLLKPNENSQP